MSCVIIGRTIGEDIDVFDASGNLVMVFRISSRKGSDVRIMLIDPKKKFKFQRVKDKRDYGETNRLIDGMKL